MISPNLIFFLIIGDIDSQYITQKNLKEFFKRNEMFIKDKDYNLIFREFYSTDMITKQDFV